MDLTITSTRTCASMPGHQLCLDYTLPAVKKIFARFLTQHPRIPDYKNCHYHYNPSSSGPISTITCSSGSYTIEAVHEKLSYVPESLSIKLSENAGGFERLFCDKDGCQAENDRANDYLFFRLYGINRCSECFNHNIPNRVPCDGPVSKFDDYLQHATVALDPVQPASPPSNPPNSPPNAWSPPSQPTSFFPNPPPPFNFGSPPPPPIFSFGNPPSQNTAFSSNPTPQNNSSFSFFQTSLGILATSYCSYKAYKEMEKMDEEGRKMEEAKTAGEDSRKAPGYRALGYVVAAIAAGVFTIYSMRA